VADAVPAHVARRHHKLGPEHVDAPHRWHAVGDFRLESGATIREFGLSFVEHGIADPDGARTILGCTAIGATHHRLDFQIGPGKALDPARWRIIVIDAIGNGLTTSPSNSRLQPGPDFPRFTIRDMVASQHLLLTRALGLERVHAVIGASMGGMQALQWGVSHPEFMSRIVAMTPMAKTANWARLINEAARRALTGDPAFAGGRYAQQPARGWRDWAIIMRGLASRTPEALAEIPDFARWLDDMQRGVAELGLDANDYVAQSHAYDAHDVGTTPGRPAGIAAALRAVAAPALIATPTLDLYNPESESEARRAACLLPKSRLVELPSSFGHQAASHADEASARLLNREIALFLGSA
jgi:homoserine O-acetyltransferase